MVLIHCSFVMYPIVVDPIFQPTIIGIAYQRCVRSWFPLPSTFSFMRQCRPTLSKETPRSAKNFWQPSGGIVLGSSLSAYFWNHLVRLSNSAFCCSQWMSGANTGSTRFAWCTYLSCAIQCRECVEWKRQSRNTRELNVWLATYVCFFFCIFTFLGSKTASLAEALRLGGIVLTVVLLPVMEKKKERKRLAWISLFERSNL